MEENFKFDNSIADMAKDIQRLAYTDYLTNLVNRRGLYLYYNELPKNSTMHFMFIDIDNFKRVNDVYGHSMGDKLLIEVSNLIRTKMPTGFVSRIGGDEFVVVVNGSWTKTEISDAAQDIIDSLSSIDFRKDILSLISLSIGIILEQSTSIMLDDILYKCDSAMYSAKNGGKNQCIIYQAMDKSAETAKSIEADMEPALINQEYEIFFQPKINMITSKLVGAEALARWIHPVDGVRLPEVFVPLFEKNGFITKLDMYIFEKICQMKASWKGFPYEHIVISLNFSRLHLYKKNLPDILMELINKYGISSSEIELEFTENVFIKDSNELIAMVTRLREVGFLVAIDNFGSGYSPLSLLKDLPVDVIKMDKTFLQLSADNARGQKVFKNVVSMCKDLKLDIVTEGIENKSQIDFVTSCGCDIAQGYYYSDPLPVSEFRKYANKRFKSSSEVIRFAFNENLDSDCNKYKCCFVGEGFSYGSGPVDSLRSVYFPGGEANKNIINMPSNVLYSQSYTVSMWLKPESLHSWTSAFFADFENGFCSFVPSAWDGNSSYRIRDNRIVDGWFDTPACCLWENTWTHVVMTYNYMTEMTILYINGILTAYNENIPPLFSPKNIILGGDVFQASFHGYIADLRIYNECKAPKEITEMFQNIQLDPTYDIHK